MPAWRRANPASRDQPQAQRVFSVQTFAQHIQLFGLCRSDQFGHEITAAIIAGHADFGKWRDEKRVDGCKSKIAGQDEREARSRMVLSPPQTTNLSRN